MLLCSVPISAQSTGDSALVPSATPNALGSAEQQLHLKLCDFGFATLCGNTRLKLFCGTPSYMAPQIVSKVEYAGPPADIWATGVLLYALLNGCFPFRGATDDDLYRRIKRGTYQIYN